MMKANANNRTVVMAVKPNTQYTYVWNRVNISSSADDSNIMLFDEYPTADVTVGTLTGNNMSSGGVRTFTTTSTTKYIAIKIANITATDFQSTLEASQLELGASSTEHEAFNGTTYTADLPTTVYGGTVDVVNGVLTVTHGYISPYNGETINEPWISDRDEYVAGTTPTTGAQVVYLLATPTTIQCDPQTVQTLIGDNNVWSDGDVSVEYVADPKRYIEKMIGA